MGRIRDAPRSHPSGNAVLPPRPVTRELLQEQFDPTSFGIRNDPMRRDGGGGDNTLRDEDEIKIVFSFTSRARTDHYENYNNNNNMTTVRWFNF